MNILITSAGRRGYIVEYFKKELNGNGLVFVGNSSPIASATIHGDRFVKTPNIYDEKYVPFLLEYCIKEKIAMVISLFDVDLPVLSRNRCLFESNGIRILVSSEEVISVCNDKWNTYNFCLKHNIETPWSCLCIDKVIKKIEHNEIKYPIVIKPRWGMGSIGVYYAYNEQELKVLTAICKREIENTYLKYETGVRIEEAIIYQENISGQEYGIDIINDIDGNYKTCVVRKKIAMRSGETDCAIIEKNSSCERIAKYIGENLKHICNMDVDVIISNNKPYLLEMNARFGGGYPFSHTAGINLPRAIIKWCNNDILSDELIVKEYDKIYMKELAIVKLDI